MTQDTRTESFSLTDETVLCAAFHDLSDEEMVVLLDDDHLLDLFDHARALVTDVQGQLETYNAGLSVGNEYNHDWRRRAVSVKTHLATFIADLRPRVVALRNRIHDEENNAVVRLAKAVKAHQATVLAEYEPTSADHRLWAELDNLPHWVTV